MFVCVIRVPARAPCAPFKDTGGSREPGQGTHTHGTHTGHTGAHGHTDHTGEPHNHPNLSTPNYLLQPQPRAARAPETTATIEHCTCLRDFSSLNKG
jgi:hypothetical protein